MSPRSAIAGAKLAADMAPFAAANGKTNALTADLQWRSGNLATPQASCVLNGLLLCPESAGVYTSRLTISSDNAGSVMIPLTLTVRE